MKKSNEILIVALAIGLACLVPNATAQTTEKPARGEHPRAEKAREKAGDKLGLTDAQKEQMKAIQAEQKAAMDALRADTSLTQEQRREKGQALRQSFGDRRNAVLTPDQRTIASEMRAKAKAHRDERGADGPTERPADRPAGGGRKSGK
ncbi:MAG: hypothetical protein Q8J74_08875 [Candidatus Didemnitutus sp.]|nr:hypothetical protein [Candidatus Didemnitutus sp.]